VEGKRGRGRGRERERNAKEKGERRSRQGHRIQNYRADYWRILGAEVILEDKTRTNYCHESRGEGISIQRDSCMIITSMEISLSTMPGNTVQVTVHVCYLTFVIGLYLNVFLLNGLSSRAVVSQSWLRNDPRGAT
jgi:hypothetical protein